MYITALQTKTKSEPPLLWWNPGTMESNFTSANLFITSCLEYFVTSLDLWYFYTWLWKNGINRTGRCTVHPVCPPNKFLAFRSKRLTSLELVLRSISKLNLWKSVSIFFKCFVSQIFPSFGWQVRKRSKACRAGLREADELVSINEEPCGTLSHAQAMDLIDSSPGILHIRVRRSEQQKYNTLVCQPPSILCNGSRKKKISKDKDPGLSQVFQTTVGYKNTKHKHVRTNSY